MFNLISICGPQEGVGKCPERIPGWLCGIFSAGPYTARFSFASYWKDVSNQQKYLQQSVFLADVNNERNPKKKQYKANMLKLNKYVLVMALNDTVIFPKESQWHGFYAWGNDSKVVDVQDSEGYEGDWIGLKTLDQQKKIDFKSFEGEHIRFSNQFWNDEILPYFDVKHSEMSSSKL